MRDFTSFLKLPLKNSLQVNVGCVPKKLMFNAAMHAEELHDQEGYGHHVKQTAPFDWK